MLIAAKIYFSLFAKFLGDYWKPILAIVLLCLYTYATYDFGFNQADKKWIAYHNKEVKELNGKITKLETDSKTEAKKLKADAASSQWALEALAKEFPTIIAKDKDNKPLMCNNKPVSVYLGSDFSDAWNKLNTKGEEK